jgi:stage II sporulation protein D
MISTLTQKALCFKKPLLQKGQLWWISALIWMAMIGPAAALELRVAISQGVKQLTVGSSTTAKVEDAAGRSLGEIAPMNAFSAQTSSKGVKLAHWQASQLWIEPSAGGYVYIGDRWYRGRTKLVKSGWGLTAVNQVDLEQYLASVLGGEMNGNWPQEALKAQAVAARSYALHKRQRHSNGVYDLGRTTSSQVYKGLAAESIGTQMAVTATAGQVLTYKGQIIEAVFHSSSGGHTENVEDIWVQPLPYLRGVQDYDQGTPVFQWVASFPASELSRRISGVGNISSMTPLRTTPHGRIVTMRVVGSAGTRTISGDALRKALNLRSTLFTVTPRLSLVASTNRASSKPESFEINGRGFGHGLGMSQWGAHNLAQSGYKHQQILQHYYQGTTLTTVPAN